MSDAWLTLAQILGGGVVAVAILHYVWRIIKELRNRPEKADPSSSRNNGSAQNRPECSLLSGQYMTVMNQQTDLMRQIVGLVAKLEAGLENIKGIAVTNSGKLDHITEGVAQVVGRDR